MIDQPQTTPEEVTAAPIGGSITQATEEIAPQTLELVEVPTVPERHLFTTPLNEYTVTEGLLLLIFVLLLGKAFLSLVKEVIGWL